MLSRHASRRLAHATRSRALSSSSSHGALEPSHSIYVSESTDVLLNLSLEDWLFRRAPPNAPLLLLYRDAPAVVLGRNQSPWAEVNLRAARARAVPWVRRRSGGGAVFHDMGNTNFSLHLPRTAFDRAATGGLVLRALHALGLPGARLNDRHDLCVGPDKVSGSAYRIAGVRAYHHGTMLISTDLGALGDLLRVSKPTMQTSGVASVRSPVTNLRAHNGAVTHDAFVAALVREFRAEHDIDVDEPVVRVSEAAARAVPEIAQGMAELPTWDWAYGQTPAFTYTLQRAFSWGTVDAALHARHGVLTNCTLALTAGARVDAPLGAVQAALSTVAEALVGQRYGFVEPDKLAAELEGGAEAREALGWLVDEMDR